MGDDPVIPAEGSNKTLLTKERSILSAEGDGLQHPSSFEALLLAQAHPRHDPARSGTAVRQEMLGKQGERRQGHAVHVPGSSGGIINPP